MDTRSPHPEPPRLAPQEFSLDAFADPSSVRDVVRGILHTIFFHRYFPTLTPQTHTILDLTLPYVAEPELETLIDQRTSSLVRDLSSTSTGSSHSHPSTPSSYAQSLPQQGKAAIGAMLGAISGGGGTSGGGGAGASGGGGGGRGKVTVQFMERSKPNRARRAGMWGGGGKVDEDVCWERWTIRVTVAEPKTDSERAKVRRATATTLQTAVMKIVTSVNTHRDHIPPITISEGVNPFPYAIWVNQRGEGGGRRGFGGVF